MVSEPYRVLKAVCPQCYGGGGWRTGHLGIQGEVEHERGWGT